MKLFTVAAQDNKDKKITLKSRIILSCSLNDTRPSKLSEIISFEYLTSGCKNRDSSANLVTG
jgi:hypothetical protein